MLGKLSDKQKQLQDRELAFLFTQIDVEYSDI